MLFKRDYYTDLDWMHRLSFRLDRFKSASASSNVFNCRCPVCGDSQKSAKKARFYFYTKNHNLNVICHNCGYSHSFWTFMKEVFPNEFDEYKRDQLKTRLDDLGGTSKHRKKPTLNNQSPDPVETPVSDSRKNLAGVQPLSALSDTHAAVKYMRGRGLKQNQIDRLLWSEDFRVTAESISHEPLSDNFPNEPRIVIPFYSDDGEIEMIQGRSLSSKGLRYLSIKTDPNVDKIYGKYEVDRSKTVYCVEGPLDSLFVDNCLATCDANLLRADADVFIFDNQPRSKEIVALIEKTIEKGKKIVIWPTSPDTKEDINDIILRGVTQTQLMKIIRDNTFSGPKAKLAFMKWRKV